MAIRFPYIVLFSDKEQGYVERSKAVIHGIKLSKQDESFVVKRLVEGTYVEDTTVYDEIAVKIQAEQDKSSSVEKKRKIYTSGPAVSVGRLVESTKALKSLVGERLLDNDSLDAYAREVVKLLLELDMQPSTIKSIVNELSKHNNKVASSSDAHDITSMYEPMK